MRLGRSSRRVLRAFCVLAEPVCRVYFLCPVGVPCVRRVGKSLQLYRSAHRPEHCVLVVRGPGVQLFLPGVDALQAQALAAVLMEETP